MPPIRTPSTVTKTPAVPIKTERSHEENQERAYIAASRRSDRSLEARVESARRASEIHKKRTGRSLRVTEQDVVNEEMYEEEDDDLPLQYRRLTAHLHTNSSDFNRRLSAYLTSHQAMRTALGQALANSYAQSANQNQPGSQAQQPWNQVPTQFNLTMPNMQSPTAHSPSSPNFRQSPYPTQTPQNFSHQRSASFATPRSMSNSAKDGATTQGSTATRRLSTSAADSLTMSSLETSKTNKDVDYSDIKQTTGNTVFPQPTGNPIWDQDNDLGPFATDLPNDARMFLDDQSLSHQYLASGSLEKPTFQTSYDGMDQTLAPGALDGKIGEDLAWNLNTSNFSDASFDSGAKQTSTSNAQDSYSSTTPADEMWAFIDDNAYDNTT